MKKVFITLAIIIVLIVVALMVIPVFFKSDILRLIEEKSSKYIQAELAIGDVNLSMFKNFPNLSVTLENVMISKEENNTRDTLVNIPHFEASVNLKSLISGDEIIINNILLKDCLFSPKVNAEGKANWDIMVPSDTTEVAARETAPEETADSGSETAVAFNNIEVRNLVLDYKDYQASTFAHVDAVNLNLKGNFSETNTILNVLLSMKNISLRQGNSVWVNNTDFNWQADIAANLKDMQFDIQKNDMALNDLKLDLIGSLGIGENKYTMDLKLNAPDTKFESLLALIPKDFQKEIEGVKTTGEFQLSMEAKGEYHENHLPAINLNFNILNASLKYPELPESVEKINLKLNVTNPGGTVAQTVANLSTLTFTIANNPFSMNVLVSNLDDPTFKGGMKGVINFESLKKALPLKDITLNGMLTTDLSFDGKYQYIEKEQYEKFTANGKIALKNVLFKSADFPEGISVPSGEITITPARLNLKDLLVKIKSSDFSLQGYVSNYLPYVFKDQTLKGNFSLTSNTINLNEFMTSTDAASETAPAGNEDTTATQPASPEAEEGIAIPKNIQVAFNTNIKQILFDSLVIKNIKGSIETNGGVATLKNLSMDMLDGNLVMNGSYNTANPAKPSVDLNLRASDIDITSTYHAFSFIKESIPIAMNCSGKISAAMKFSSELDKEMSPIMTTANGGGSLSTTGFLIKDNPAMLQLANLLKNDELSRLSIANLKIDFKINNGNITVEPFTTNIAGNPTTFHGTQTVNGEMDYVMSMNIARKYFGKDIDNVLKAIPGANNIKSLDVDVKIGGTLSKPTVTPDLSKALKSIEKEAGKELKNNILKGLDKLFK